MIILPLALVGLLSCVDVGDIPRAPFRYPQTVWSELAKPGLPSNARKKGRRHA